MVYNDPDLYKMAKKEVLLSVESNINEINDSVGVLVDMYATLIDKHYNYQTRMRKYEWIESLLQTATRFLRYLLPKHTNKV